jgi:hypothetical protein
VLENHRQTGQVGMLARYWRVGMVHCQPALVSISSWLCQQALLGSARRFQTRFLLSSVLLRRFNRALTGAFDDHS